MSWLSEIYNEISGHNARERQQTAVTAQNQNQDFQQQQLTQQQDIARQQQAEQERLRQQTQQRAEQGRASVERTFAPFNDTYFNDAAKRYAAGYTPGIEDQYKIALDKLTADLAGRGTLQSTVGANRLAELAKTKADALAGKANEGVSWANNLRGQVNQSRDKLFADAASAADPSSIASRATGEATSLANSGATTPAPQLGNIFQSFLPVVTNAVTAYGNRSGTGSVSSSAPISGAGSSRIFG